MLCVCVSLWVSLQVGIGARLLALSLALLYQTECVLRLGTCAGSLIKYAVGVSAAAEMPNRENRREKRELEKDSEYVMPPAHFQPLLSPLYRRTCQLRLFTLVYLSLPFFRISSLSLSTPPTKFARSYPHSYPQPFTSLTLSFPQNWMSFIPLLIPFSLERAVQSFSHPPHTAGSLRTWQKSLLWHSQLLLDFLFPCPYKHFLCDERVTSQCCSDTESCSGRPQT